MYCNWCQHESDNCDDFREGTAGNHYCQLCWDGMFAECVHCGKVVRINDASSDPDGDAVCDDCFNDRYTRCDACGDVINQDDATRSEAGDDYCERCYNRRFFTCRGCDAECDQDEYNEGGYCDDCAEHMRDEDEYGYDWLAGRDVLGREFLKIRSRRKFGVELEVSSAPGYRDMEDNTVFGAKDDGTRGVVKEFVSPVLQGDEGLDAVAEWCKQAGSFEVADCCGYHLHIDCTGLGVRQRKAVALAYVMTRNVWASFVTEKRRVNHFCHSGQWGAYDILHSTWDALMQDIGCDRYRWCNWLAYNRHNTVEIRLHTGTVNYAKITNWVKAHVRFVDWAAGHTAEEVYAKLGGKTSRELFDMLCGIWGDDELSGFYRRRAAKFGTEYAERTTV